MGYPRSDDGVEGFDLELDNDLLSGAKRIGSGHDRIRVEYGCKSDPSSFGLTEGMI